MGNACRNDETTPVLTQGIETRCTEIAAGATHTLALNRDGQLYSTGSNDSGELGIGDQKGQNFFVTLTEMSHIRIKQIAAGDGQSAALSSSSELYVWGTGSFGEFLIPHCVKTIKGKVKNIQIGSKFGAAVTQKGSVYTWGDNEAG